MIQCQLFIFINFILPLHFPSISTFFFFLTCRPLRSPPFPPHPAFPSQSMHSFPSSQVTCTLLLTSFSLSYFLLLLPMNLRVSLSSPPPCLPLLAPFPPTYHQVVSLCPAPPHSHRGKALHWVGHTGCRSFGLRSLLNTLLGGHTHSRSQAHTEHVHPAPPHNSILHSGCLRLLGVGVAPSLRQYIILATH